jgi:flagellin
VTVFNNGGVGHTLGQIGRNQSAMSGSLRRISSGRRIARAADDPAGRAVAVNLQTLDLATRRAMKNLNDGVSLIQVADSAGGETTDILQRMRELAIQSASGSLADSGRSSLESEFTSLRDEIDRVAEGARFNGLPLAEGTVAGVVVHASAGSGSSHRIAIPLGDLRAATLGVGTSSVATETLAQSSLDDIDGALGSVNGVRSRLGASHNRLTSALQSAENYVTALSMARSVVEDADLGAESVELTLQRVRQSGGLSALATGLRSMQTSRALLMGSPGGGGGMGGVPPYVKGDFPEDLVSP